MKDTAQKLGINFVWIGPRPRDTWILNKYPNLLAEQMLQEVKRKQGLLGNCFGCRKKTNDHPSVQINFWVLKCWMKDIGPLLNKSIKLNAVEDLLAIDDPESETASSRLLLANMKKCLDICCKYEAYGLAKEFVSSYILYKRGGWFLDTTTVCDHKRLLQHKSSTPLMVRLGDEGTNLYDDGEGVLEVVIRLDVWALYNPDPRLLHKSENNFFKMLLNNYISKISGYFPRRFHGNVLCCEFINRCLWSMDEGDNKLRDLSIIDRGVCVRDRMIGEIIIQSCWQTIKQYMGALDVVAQT